MVFGRCLGPWTFKNELLVWARCYFSEITFFVRPKLFLDRFLDDFGWLWGSFWKPKWNQNGFKKRSNKIMDFGIAPGRALDRQGTPGRSKGRGERPTERGRGEVNLSPKGIGDVGNGERGLLNHWTPQRGWWDSEIEFLGAVGWTETICRAGLKTSSSG